MKPLLKTPNQPLDTHSLPSSSTGPTTLPRQAITLLKPPTQHAQYSKQ